MIYLLKLGMLTLRVLIVTMPFLVAIIAILLAGWLNNWTWQSAAAVLIGSTGTSFNAGWIKARKEHPL